ncbi:CLK4-associating serine/arginine rich protein-like [Uloborus diversus]|uniref:CLK4-associating serine/arginine rich protein-like n=1 Tax=Uloborus diversus TaxID=327109 RepID=UPI0024093386|nr:CLK4-associating serine/arginine rich protein-like [Uloborus diversus]
MWHEARKQEKKIRGMMVDYKRRAERRREYYEKIKQDPAQFLQVHGRPAKIHLDPAVAIAADSPATMMPWQGHADNLIDRFDVRAHLDIIPEYKPVESIKVLNEDDDRKTSYESYRTLVQNDFLSVNEDKFLHQIFMEERFGIFKPGYEEEKKKLMDKKAAIGYVYEDSTESPPHLNNVKSIDAEEDEEENEEEKEEDLSDIDLDVTVDVSVLTPSQCAEMNSQSIKYGMVDDDFITYLLQDKEEAEQLKLAREIEEEKAMYSGRKSRRERRALREKKLAGRRITSPPSYAARDSPTYTPMRHSTSKSRSRSPPDAGKIMFITSFGDEVSDGEHRKSTDVNTAVIVKRGKNSKTKDGSSSVIGPQLPSKNGDEEKHFSDSHASKYSVSSESSRSSGHSKKKSSKDRKRYSRHRRHSSRSSSRSSSLPRKSASSKNKRRNRSRSKSRSRSHSESRSRAKTKSRSRSRSKSNTKMNSEKSPELPPPPVKSYYRHSLSRSNSDVSDDSEEEKSNSSSMNLTNFSSVPRLQALTGKAAPATKAKMTPQERLKRKMQLALKRQYKADKKAQMEKTEKQLQERQDRAEELREMAIKLRQRERERRHRQRGYGYDSDSDTTWTRNPEYSAHASDGPPTSRKKDTASSGSDSSYSSSQEHSPSRTTSSTGRKRSRTKSPQRSSNRRSPDDRRKFSPVRKVNRRSPLRRNSRSPPRRNSRSPPRRNSRSPPRRNSRSPNRRNSRSPQRNYRRTPERRHYGSRDYRRSPPRKRSPSRSPSRRYSSSRHYRRSNHSRSRSRSTSRSYGTRPLVDY